MELYCDNLQDLLADKKDAGQKYMIKKDKKGLVYVQNSKIEEVSSIEELQETFGTWFKLTKWLNWKPKIFQSFIQVILSVWSRNFSSKPC